MSSQSLEVIKLNNENYFVWKIRMEFLLRAQNLWCIVQDGMRHNDEQWQIKDKKARAFIVIALNDDQIDHINDKTTASETWQTLKDIHEKNTFMKQIHSFKTICSSTMNRTQNIEDHINDFSASFDKLLDMGDTLLSDDWKIKFLLASLPKSYESIISKFGKVPKEDLTWTFVCEKLLDQYKRLKGQYDFGVPSSMFKMIQPSNPKLSIEEVISLLYE